ncbi:serine/threonine-protein kinase [Clostridium cibarium]|uniref:Protein kinase n=1 Tax=Clostridium cibarium TaxID=2762247 RepID=A0ABR8PY01_9CLOT|nr:serine/threonine-protein kinase [Clostridium cibarium]MBD7913047.1 protein kinase [Clostridium cibarium]
MGQIIGDRYLLINPIGNNKKDNMDKSELYFARDMKSKEGVCLKLIKKDGFIDNDTRAELFKREYMSLRRLNHEKIIKYIDSGQDDDNLYIVTEYYYGDTLRDYITKNDITIEEKLKIAINITEALEYSHEKSVIHRDLKPDNIMINSPDDIKIIDFGISKILTQQYKTSQTVKCYMTIKYAAPEQLMRYEAIIESDIYSLGLNIAYLFSEIEPPDDKREVVQYIEKVSCSNNMKLLIKRMTEYEVEKRSKSLIEVKRILEKEYNELSAKTKKIYIRYNHYIKKLLLQMGYLEYRGDEHAYKFIKDDLISSYISKNDKNGKYYLIGKDVKYTCTLDNNSRYLLIQNVNVIEDHLQWEDEIRGKIHVQLPWSPINNEDKIGENNYISNLIQQIINEKRKAKTKRNRSEIKNVLLNKWDTYLKEEYNEINRKKRICRYNNLILDETGYKIYVDVEELDTDIEVGDVLQLTLEKSGQVSVGEFEDYSDNRLTIKLNADINPSYIAQRGIVGIDSRKSIANFRKLSRALNLLIAGNTVNRNLQDIITEPSLVEMDCPYEISDYVQDVLKNSVDSPNAEVVRKALGTKDIFLIQGPPGTGKSTVITELVCQILNINPDDKILITSQSNVAVDHVINKIVPLLDNIRVIRVGRNEKISLESKNLIMSQQLNKWVEEVKEESKINLKKYLKSNYNYSLEENEIDTKNIEHLDLEHEENSEEINLDRKQKIIDLTIEWHRRLGKLDEFYDIYASKASIIASTCLGMESKHVLNDIEYDWVIVDEAARANALELLVSLTKGKRIVLVGDHRQLPPVVNIELDRNRLEEKKIKQSELEISLFQDLFEKLPDSSKSILNSQYRMHPQISKLISNIFYPEIDINTILSENDRKHYLNWQPKCIKWINTSKVKDCFEVSDILQSKKNPCEARAILKELENIESNYEKKSKKGISVGIISGYDAHKKLLIDLIKPHDKKRWRCIDIIIDNVDAFQGSETDIVIYSMVRCNNENKIGFLYDSRRLNVALSRGKTALIIVGNIRFAETAKSYRGNPFVDIITFIKKHNKYCFVEEYNEN